jgi:hypothetical protein
MLKKQLNGKRCATDADVKQAVTSWLQTLNTDFFLVSRWDHCSNVCCDSEVWCVPSAARLPCIRQSQIKALGIIAWSLPYFFKLRCSLASNTCVTSLRRRRFSSEVECVTVVLRSRGHNRWSGFSSACADQNCSKKWQWKDHRFLLGSRKHACRCWGWHPKMLPSNFLWLVSRHRELVGSEGYNLLIPPTTSVKTMAEVLDGNNYTRVRIVFPVLMRGPKPVWAQTYENRAPLSRSSNWT